MVEIFTATIEDDEFKISVNRDLLIAYGVSDEDFNSKFDYELMESLKNNICKILREGTLTSGGK